MKLHLLPAEIQNSIASFLEDDDTLNLSLVSKSVYKSLKHIGLPNIEFRKKMIVNDFLKKNPDASSLLNSWNKFKSPNKAIERWYFDGVLKARTVFMRENGEQHYTLQSRITDNYEEIAILNKLIKASPLEQITIVNQNLKIIRSAILNTKGVVRSCVKAFNLYFREERVFHDLENGGLNFGVKCLVWFIFVLGLAVIEDQLNHNGSIFGGLKICFAAGILEIVRKKTVDLADPNNKRLIDAFTNLAPDFVLSNPDKLKEKFTNLKARLDRLK